MKLLVTGSSGFIGSRVVELARSQDMDILPVVRGRSQLAQSNCFTVPSIESSTDWSGAFDSVDCVVHCAARVHQMKESELDAGNAYYEVNTLGTLNLARQAALAGVKRFVFISTIKVNGEFSVSDSPFQAVCCAPPLDPYGASKYQAEEGLKVIGQETGLEVVIIRPPLVYGPNVKANFFSMIRLIDKGIPLPLGAIYNQRSLVYLDNLVDLILTSCEHLKAAGETFLVSDNEDISTSQLLRKVGEAMNRPARLLPIPMSLISLGAKVLGKPQIAQRLCGNLQVDLSYTTKVLGWKPPVTIEDGIRRTVLAYLDSK